MAKESILTVTVRRGTSVVDGADLANGLLHVALKQVVPETLKPRRIPVQAGRKAIEAETAQAA